MITREQLTRTDSTTFSAEASTLGWQPGHWPAQVDVERGIGNSQPLIRKRHVMFDGELQFCEYWQAFGAVRVTVFND